MRKGELDHARGEVIITQYRGITCPGCGAFYGKGYKLPDGRCKVCARVLSELGPVSRAMLKYIQGRRGYIEIFRMIKTVSKETGESHNNDWYFRRLVALTFEGRIEGTVHRNGDLLVIRFRRIDDKGIEEFPKNEGDSGR